MLNSGKCPKCDQVVYNIILEEISVAAVMGNSLLGLSYLCPNCRVILSVQIDPVAIKNSILNGVTDLLTKKTP